MPDRSPDPERPFSREVAQCKEISGFPSSPSAAAGGAPAESDADAVRSASELDYPPFAVVRDDGSADGFSVDVLRAVAGALGKNIQFTVGPWHEIKQQLIAGRLDVLPLVSYSEEWERVLDFSAPYMRLHGAIFVRAGDHSIRGEADLKDKEVITMRGDNAHEYALRNRLTAQLFLTDSYEEALTLLSSGRHDAVLMLQLVGFQLLKKLDITNVVSINSVKEMDIRPVAAPLSVIIATNPPQNPTTKSAPFPSAKRDRPEVFGSVFLP